MGPPLVVVVGGTTTVGVEGAGVVVGPEALGSPAGVGKRVAAEGFGGALAAGMPPAIAFAAIANQRPDRQGTLRPTYRKKARSQLSPKWQQC